MSTDTMSPPATATIGHGDGRPDIHLEIFIWGTAGALALAFIVAYGYYAKTSHGQEWPYVAALLGLPLLQVPVVIRMLRKNSDFWAKVATDAGRVIACP